MYTTLIIQMWSYYYFGIQRLRSKLCPECLTDLGPKILLEISTLTKASLSPEYFVCLPVLTEIEIEAEQNGPPICINFSSF